MAGVHANDSNISNNIINDNIISTDIIINDIVIRILLLIINDGTLAMAVQVFKLIFLLIQVIVQSLELLGRFHDFLKIRKSKSK